MASKNRAEKEKRTRRRSAVGEYTRAQLDQDKVEDEYDHENFVKEEIDVVRITTDKSTGCRIYKKPSLSCES